jgi:methyl-accepting chemotaxis protein
LSYPVAAGLRGKYSIPPDIMTQLATVNKTVISDVYFDENLQMAFLDIYTSIASDKGTVAGIGRSTLMLNDVWTAVNNETNAATGSYAMVIDGHGVRIAYTNPDTTLTTQPKALFKSMATLPSGFLQQVKDENLYGNSHAAVTTLQDSQLVSELGNSNSVSYQFTPVEFSQPYQAYQVRSLVLPWTYIVLRPIDTITGAATQQDIYLVILAIVVTVLAAVVGLVIGRQATRPILKSVSLLAASSDSLKRLAAREQARAKEQKWIVESAQTGLKSVQYYAKASGIAAHKLDEIGQDINQNWDQLDNVKRQRRLYEIVSAASYIEKAAGHQERSSKGLTTAIQVTNQVAEQLIAGATSASEAATQLEEVIAQLRQVVGE